MNSGNDSYMMWEEMIKNFPNMWVAVKDAVMKGPDIISGIVVAVLSDDEICAYEDSHLDEELEYARTTEDTEINGFIDSNLIIRID